MNLRAEGSIAPDEVYELADAISQMLPGGSNPHLASSILATQNEPSFPVDLSSEDRLAYSLATALLVLGWSKTPPPAPPVSDSVVMGTMDMIRGLSYALRELGTPDENSVNKVAEIEALDLAAMEDLHARLTAFVLVRRLAKAVSR